MILRFLLLALVIYVIYFWLRRAAARARNTAAPPAQENMVVCAHCGVHLPQSDSIAAGARFYCTEEHRIAGPK